MWHSHLAELVLPLGVELAELLVGGAPGAGLREVYGEAGRRRALLRIHLLAALQRGMVASVQQAMCQAQRTLGLKATQHALIRGSQARWVGHWACDCLGARA